MVTDTRRIMLTVAVCLVPGLAAEAAIFSAAGVGLNLAAALTAAVATEHLCLRLAGRITPLAATDPSALVTALILAAALPPGTPGITAIATVTALALGKHVYGGPGNNVFNPAMVGYALVLVSFPAALDQWPQARWLPAADADGLTGATALTEFKYRGAATVSDLWREANGFGLLGALGHEWVSLAFLAGGLVLFQRRMAAWRPAAAMLLTLVVLGLAGYDGGSSSSLGSPAYHLFSGATLLAACFVATDPVTHPTSRRGQWLFGMVVGLITWCVRAWGNYPDGIAFAILLGNALTPYLDRRLAVGGASSHG